MRSNLIGGVECATYDFQLVTALGAAAWASSGEWVTVGFLNAGGHLYRTVSFQGAASLGTMHSIAESLGLEYEEVTDDPCHPAASGYYRDRRGR